MAREFLAACMACVSALLVLTAGWGVEVDRALGAEVAAKTAVPVLDP